MNELPEKKLLEFIRQHQLIDSGERVLLAISGGLDSMVMARLFSATKINFGVAHVNFNLRGKSSIEDALFVETWCKKNKRPYFELDANTKSYSKKHGLSLQEAAREIRYKWFTEIAGAHGYLKIATAHHLDDSIETFFINLLRGTGIRGIAGIPSKNGNIIRPLLFASRSDLEQWAKKLRIKHREDASNESDAYLRNRIRHHLIPMMVQLQPAFRNIMDRNLENIRFAGSLYEQRLDQYIKMMVKHAGMHQEISIHGLNEHAQPDVLLREIIHRLGGSLPEPEKVLKPGLSGKKFNSGELTITRDRNKLIISKQSSEADVCLTVVKNDKSITTPFGTLTLKKTTYQKSRPLPQGPNQLAFDLSLLTFPLELRSWRPGDRFTPFGMKNSVKVSDFLTGRKVPLPVKKQTLVLVTKEEILCILGHRLGEHFKVTPSTRQVLTIDWQPAN